MGDHGDWSLFPYVASHPERMLGRPAAERVFAGEELSLSITE